MVGLSVVVPTKNEEKYIRTCMDSLLRQRGRCPGMEIVVIDNGSTDGTRRILEDYGNEITVAVRPDLTLPELRNFGASMSSGEWIAFVDGDVEVDHDWVGAIETVLSQLESRGYDLRNVVTGSTYDVPRNPSWVERVWFDQLVLRNKTKRGHINSGNLIVHRNLFDRVAGFDARYKTGEDIKLCEDARSCGGVIVEDNRIRAVHHGYPKTLRHFVSRERWHGQGMKEYFARPWRSRGLSFALYDMLVFSFALTTLVLSGSLFVPLAILLVGLPAPSLILAAFRCKGGVLDTIRLAFLFLVSGISRVLSICDIVRANNRNRLK